MPTCNHCGAALPPNSDSRRRWCSDRCRKAASRSSATTPAGERGPVATAVAAAFELVDFGRPYDQARAALALSLAQKVDAGSVPAAAQLRGVLDELDVEEEPEFATFLASIQTPVTNG